MNWYGIFYWLTVADSVKSFFDTTSNIFTTFTIIAFIALIVVGIGESYTVDDANLKNEAEEKENPTYRSWLKFGKMVKRLFYPFLILAILTWAGYVFTPTKKDCLLIVAGGAVGNFMTSDSSAKQLPGDVTKFLHMSLKSEIANLSEDARKELGVESPKEKLLDKVKKLSKEELINYLQSDSTLLKQ